VPIYESFGKPTSGSIPTIIRGFKATVTKQINQVRNTVGLPFWQRNYYEHIIGNERELNCIREYIYYNPQKWELDIENPIIWKNKKETNINKYYKNIFKGAMAYAIRPYGDK
jgi:hypothetical protein